jgi:hypothetical protein
VLVHAVQERPGSWQAGEGRQVLAELWPMYSV